MQNNQSLPDGFILDEDFEETNPKVAPQIFIIDDNSELTETFFIRGPKGDKGDQGLVGEKGDKGDKGDQGPPMEWEFCPIDGDKMAGIRIRKPNGKWSDCVRFKGKDGIDGKDGRHGVDGKVVAGGGALVKSTDGTYIGPYTTVINSVFDAGPFVVMLVDTTDNSVNIVLPDAKTSWDKQFHIKWIKSVCNKNRRVVISAQPSQLIDWEIYQVMAEVLDSLHLFSNGEHWFIV